MLNDYGSSLIIEVPLTINAMKRLLDDGVEILTLKHIYDLSNQEIQEILGLYEDKK